MRWAPAGQRPASGRVVAASGRTRHDRWASPNRGAWRVKRCPEGGLIVAARHSVSSRSEGTPFRRMAHSPGLSCPRCGSRAPDGLVLDASGACQPR